jgi:hypothetical protein
MRRREDLCEFIAAKVFQLRQASNSWEAGVVGRSHA